MDDVDGGDMGYIPSGMIPAGLDFEQEPPTAASFGEAYGEQDADGGIADDESCGCRIC